MSLKISCADFTFPLLPHDRALDLIADLGFDGVDIGLFEKRGHLQPSGELPDLKRSADRLRRKLAARGLELADVFLIPGTSFAEMAPNHPDSKVRGRAREQFRQVVEYTLRAGGRHVGALPGIAWAGVSRLESFKRSVEELAWRAGYARAQGLVYSIEPHLGSIVPTPVTAAKLVAATPGLTLTLDYGHFTRAGFGDAEIEPLVRLASHFHCRGGRKGRLQTSFKDNAIDFARVLRVMRRVGYRGFVTMECVWSEWERCNEADNLSETILFRDFLRQKAGAA